MTPPNVLLSGIVGSVAYGLRQPDETKVSAKPEGRC